MIFNKLFWKYIVCLNILEDNAACQRLLFQVKSLDKKLQRTLYLESKSRTDGTLERLFFHFLNSVSKRGLNKNYGTSDFNPPAPSPTHSHVRTSDFPPLYLLGFGAISCKNINMYIYILLMLIVILKITFENYSEKSLL